MTPARVDYKYRFLVSKFVNRIKVIRFCWNYYRHGSGFDLVKDANILLKLATNWTIIESKPI